MPQSTYQYVLIFVVLALAALLASLIMRRANAARRRGWLLRQWGEAADRKYTPNELAGIRAQAALLAGDGGFAVDNITWNDLDMDRLYERVNLTYTDAGDHVLYGMLRNPLTGAAELKRRGRFIDWAKRDADGRERLKRTLYDLGRSGAVDLQALFSGDWYQASRLAGCVALSVGLALAIVLSIAGVGAAVIPAILLAIANVLISMRARGMIGGYINLSQQIPLVLLAARRIAGQGVPELKQENNRITELLGRVKGVMGSNLQAFYNSYSNPADVLMYFKLFFLMELISFYRLARSIRRHRDEILEAYGLVGLVDGMIAAAGWRETLPQYCEPELDDKAGACAITFEELVHPMLQDPVPNSVDLNGNLLLTGSNATGKSTFLKTVAINAILAQSLCTCTASAWRGGFFRVYTSMALRDDIFSNESYFITEIRSLKRMLDSLDGDPPCLCIVDEVLRGTNTGERIAAAAEALMRFAQGRCLCLAATHDIELTHILDGVYRNMHFTETVEDGKILFDYKLRPGRSQSRNAIKLLGLLDYGEDLVGAANRRLEHFEKTGRWESTAE